MTIEIWMAFVFATTLLLLIPGPTVMLVVGYALSSGRGTAWRTVPGVALGDFVAMTLSLAGLGAILATSAEAFTVLKWVGALYLVYLGIKMWRATPTLGDLETDTKRGSGWSMTTHAFAVTALNPKGVVFFGAFLPQFLTSSEPVMPQLLILGTTFLILAILNAAGFALLAGTVRQRLRSEKILRRINRAGGSLLIGAGVMMATLRRST